MGALPSSDHCLAPLAPAEPRGAHGRKGWGPEPGGQVPPSVAAAAHTHPRGLKAHSLPLIKLTYLCHLFLQRQRGWTRVGRAEVGLPPQSPAASTHMYRRRPCTAVSHCTDDLRAQEAWRWGGPASGALPSPGQDLPLPRGGALLAVVAKADDVRVGAVGAGDGLILEDACNTQEAAAGSPPRPPGEPSPLGPAGCTGPHSPQ